MALNVNESVFRDCLIEFLSKNLNKPTCDFKFIDSITVSYLFGIFQDLSSNDLNEFVECLNNGFPEISEIPQIITVQWINELNKQFRKPNFSKVATQNETETKSISLHLGDHITFKLPKITDNNKSVEENILDDVTKAFSREIEKLQEMFPKVFILELKHCLTVANGNIERATQLVLDREEIGESITSNSISPVGNKTVVNNEIKTQIVEKYCYVEQKSPSKSHKPQLPKEPPKKLVRYRDGKVVNIKGEKYTEILSNKSIDGSDDSKKSKKSIL